METRALLSGDTPGAPDLTWGTNGSGRVVVDFDASGVSTDNATALAVQDAGGKVVVAGVATGGDNRQRFAVTRRNPDGSADTTFGAGGLVTTAFPTGGALAAAVAVDGQGRTVVAGRVGLAAPQGFGVAVARYTVGGALDTSFGDPNNAGLRTGTVILDDIGMSVDDISLALDASDRVVVGLTATVGATAAAAQQNIAAVRLEGDGDLDPSFGSGGVAITDLSTAERSGGVAIDVNGNILQAGLADLGSGAQLVTVRHVVSPVANDPGYGNVANRPNLFVSPQRMDLVSSVLIDPDGRLLVAGSLFRTGPTPASPTGHLTLASVSPLGASAQVTHTDLTSDDPTWGLGVQSDGKILVAGNRFSDFEFGVNNYVVARFAPPAPAPSPAPAPAAGALALDGTFANDGVFTSALGTVRGVAVAGDADGQVLVAAFGTLAPGSDDDVVLFRHRSGVLAGPATITADANSEDRSYTAPEGVSVALRGAGSLGGSPGGVQFLNGPRRAVNLPPSGGNGGVVVLEWDLDADGAFDDFTGAEPTLAGAGLNGPATIPVALRVSEIGNPANAVISPATVTINNIAPTGAIVGPASVTEGDGGTVTLTASVDDVPADLAKMAYAWHATDGTRVVTGDASTLLLDASDDAVWTVNLLVDDRDGGSHQVPTKTVTVVNLAPAAQVVAPSAVEEGSLVTAHAQAQDVAGDSVLQYGWVVTKNGAATPYATGGGTGAAGAAFAFRPDDDGTYALTLTVTDDGGAHTVATRTVNAVNVAPVPNLTGDAFGVRGQERTLTLAATDPSDLDQLAGFTYTVDWGDDTPVEHYGSDATEVTHTYAAASADPYGVTVTATDRNGATGTPVVFSMLVQSANVQGGILAVSGGVGSDKIRLFGSSGQLSVGISDVAGGGAEFVQTYSEPVTRVVVFGQSGDDQVNAEALALPVEIFGGDGHDKLTGGSAADVLIGGSGDDKLVGNAGRDVLVGGRGADRIIGNADEDVLIGGYTAHDGDLLALRAISLEWTSGRTYLQRVANLKGDTSTGFNGSALLRANVTTWDDRATDLLAGEAGQDWFLFNEDRDGARDKVVDPTSSELLDDVDAE